MKLLSFLKEPNTSLFSGQWPTQPISKVKLIKKNDQFTQSAITPNMFPNRNPERNPNIHPKPSKTTKASASYKSNLQRFAPRSNCCRRDTNETPITTELSIVKGKRFGGAALEYIIVTIFSAAAAVTVMEVVKKIIQTETEKLEQSLDQDPS